MTKDSNNIEAADNLLHEHVLICPDCNKIPVELGYINRKELLEKLKPEHSDICNTNFSYAQSAGCNCTYKAENEVKAKVTNLIKEMEDE